MISPGDIRQRTNHALYSPESANFPFTEFIPPGCWVSSTRVGAATHLVDWAVAVWDGDVPHFGAQAVCGQTIIRADLHMEPPEDGLRLCDACVLADSMPIVVYRFFDGDGGLLYVGSTTNMLARLVGHRSPQTISARWWPLVASATCTRYPSIAEAQRAERAAIVNERPRFNQAIPGVTRFMRLPDAAPSSPGLVPQRSPAAKPG